MPIILGIVIGVLGIAALDWWRAKQAAAAAPQIPAQSSVCDGLVATQCTEVMSALVSTDVNTVVATATKYKAYNVAYAALMARAASMGYRPPVQQTGAIVPMFPPSPGDLAAQACYAAWLSHQTGGPGPGGGARGGGGGPRGGGAAPRAGGGRIGAPRAAPARLGRPGMAPRLGMPKMAPQLPPAKAPAINPKFAQPIQPAKAPVINPKFAQPLVPLGGGGGGGGGGGWGGHGHHHDHGFFGWFGWPWAGPYDISQPDQTPLDPVCQWAMTSASSDELVKLLPQYADQPDVTSCLSSRIAALRSAGL